MRTRRRTRRDNVMAVPPSLNNTRVPIMEQGISSTIQSLPNNNNDGQTPEVLQLTNICSLSQGSEQYNSSIALLLDWEKKTSDNPVGEKTSVTAKDYKLICQVESDSISATSVVPNANSTEVAAKSQPPFSEADGNQKHENLLPINSEKEASESTTEDVFCCILGWLARSTGQSLCSCKKEQYTLPASDSLSKFDVNSTPSKNSSKQVEPASLISENGAEPPSPALEHPKSRLNNNCTSAERPEYSPKSITKSPMGFLDKRDASTSTQRNNPLVTNCPVNGTEQKPKDKKDSLPCKDVLNIKKEPDLEEEYAPGKENGTGGIQLKGKCDKVNSPLPKDSPVLKQPEVMGHASKAEHVKLPLIDVSHIKKESDMEEREISKELPSLCGIKRERKEDSLPVTLPHTFQAENINLPNKGQLTIKQERDPKESSTGKEPNNVYCCILSWLAQGTGKQVQCTCAGEGKTDISMPSSESVSKSTDSSSTPGTKRRHSRRIGAQTKRGLKKSSEDAQTTELADPLPEAPKVTWQSLFGPQPETSGANCNRGKKRKRNSSISEQPEYPWATESAVRQQLQNPPLSWLSLLGLQNQRTANSKGKLQRKGFSEEEMRSWAQSRMQGRWPLSTQSEDGLDTSMVSSQRLKSEILNMIKAKTAYVNGNPEQNVGKGRGRSAAGTTQLAGRWNTSVSGSGIVTKPRGKPGPKPGTKRKTGNASGSEQQSGKGKTKIAAGAKRGAGKKTGNWGGKSKGKLSAGSVQGAGKSGFKLVGRTGSTAARKYTKKNQQDGASIAQGQTPPEQKRKKPGPKKGSKKKLVLLEPSPEVVQQTVDITLNYLSQIFFLEKLF